MYTVISEWLVALAVVALLAWSLRPLRAAAQDWIVTNGLAYHFERGHNYNWLTAGVGFEKSVSPTVRAAGGFYLNSNRDWSTYGAAVWLPFAADALGGRFLSGVIAGAVTGYRSTVTPAGGFVAAFEQRNYGFNVVGVPPVAGTDGVLWLQAKTRW